MTCKRTKSSSDNEERYRRIAKNNFGRHTQKSKIQHYDRRIDGCVIK